MRSTYVFRGHVQDQQSWNSNPIPGPISPAIENSFRFVKLIAVYYHFPRLSVPHKWLEKKKIIKQDKEQEESIA